MLLVARKPDRAAALTRYMYRLVILVTILDLKIIQLYSLHRFSLHLHGSGTRYWSETECRLAGLLPYIIYIYICRHVYVQLLKAYRIKFQKFAAHSHKDALINETFIPT